MKIYFYILLVTVVSSGCMSITTLDVHLEKTDIVTRSNEFLFGRNTNFSKDFDNHKERKCIRFGITSKKELYKYFVEEWDRENIQVRCDVTRNSWWPWWHSVSTFGYGPYYRNINISALNPRSEIEIKKSADGLYRYDIYAFIDLKEPEHYESGTPIPEISYENFSEISCYIIGVTMAPVIFPKTNDFSISNNEFKIIYEKYNGTRENKLPNKALQPTQKPHG